MYIFIRMDVTVHMHGQRAHPRKTYTVTHVQRLQRRVR